MVMEVELSPNYWLERSTIKNIKKYSNNYYVLKNDDIKDTRMRRTYSGRKQKATGFVYLKDSPCCDAEVSSQIISCLHDAIINAAPRIGEK